jgi:hypothetical protein
MYSIRIARTLMGSPPALRRAGKAGSGSSGTGIYSKLEPIRTGGLGVLRGATVAR